MVLQGNWQLFDDRLHLSVWVRLPETETSNVLIATGSDSVNVDGRLRRLLEHDLVSLGNHVVKELQNRASGFDREYRALHVGRFSLNCMGGQEPAGTEALKEVPCSGLADPRIFRPETCEQPGCSASRLRAGRVTVPCT